MPVSCPKLIYLYDLICHFSETFAKSAAFFHSIPPVVWIFWQMSIQFYLWRSLLKFLKSPSSSWDLRSSSSSSEVRQKFVRNSSSSSEVRQVRSSSKVRQVLQKFVKFVGGLGGGPNWESGQLIFLILMGKTSFVFWFFGWPNNFIYFVVKKWDLTNLTNFWRTWRTSDEPDELLTNLTNFWRTSDELLTNLRRTWRTSDLWKKHVFMGCSEVPAFSSGFLFFCSRPLWKRHWDLTTRTCIAGVIGLWADFVFK